VTLLKGFSGVAGEWIEFAVNLFNLKKIPVALIRLSLPRPLDKTVKSGLSQAFRTHGSSVSVFELV
jgi:hypothetical protein